MHHQKLRLASSASLSDARSYFAVKLILILTVGVFALQLVTQRPEGGSVVFDLLALEHTHVFQQGQCWRLLTYTLLHSTENPMHILCNMLVLFFLGRVVSIKTGEGEFLAIYGMAAVMAGMMQACAQAIMASGVQGWTIGASGAVMGVFVMFTMWYPEVKLHLFGVIGVKAKWLLGVVVSYDLLGLFGMAPGLFAAPGSNIGHAAHLGGAAFGFLYVKSEMQLTNWWNHFAGRKLAAVSGGHNLRVFNPGTQPEVNFSGRVDDLLTKISTQGESSLTDRERRYLKQASQHLSNSR